MKKYLLLLILIFFSTGLFSQQPCGKDSIEVMKENIQIDTTKADTTVFSVTFAEIPGVTRFAVDQYKEVYKEVTEYYQQYKAADKEIAASAKFMLPGTSDKFAVKINGTPGQGFEPTRVHFVTMAGKEYQASYLPEKLQWELTVVASDAGDGQELFVVYEKEPGKYVTVDLINIYSYEPIKRSVTLVPVNNAKNGLSRESVENGLNRIYDKIGIHWTVNMQDTAFNYTPKNGSSFNVTGSGLFSTLTDDMKAINEAFKQSGQYQEDGLYLFILPFEPNDKSQTANTNGDMPLGSQFGYLFPNATDRTIAHEAGHGAFNLEHPFDRPLRGSFLQGALTDNLMDYTEGTDFAKLQWDQTRKPGLVIGLFQKDKSGMIVLGSNEYTGFAPDGRVVYQQTGFKTIQISNDSRYVQGFITNENKNYRWDSNKNDYCRYDSLIKVFDEKDIFLNGTWFTNSVVSGKVAVWRKGDSDCYKLYKYIPVNNYTSSQFNNLQETINSPDGEWKADFNVVDNSKEVSDECRKAAQTQIDSLNGNICNKNYKADNPGSIAYYINRNSQCLSELTKEERISMLQILVEYMKGSQVGGDYDMNDAVCRILLSIPTVEEKSEIYNDLKTYTLPNDETLFETIVNDMADDALVVFSKWLMQYITEKELYTPETVNRNTTLPSFFYKGRLIEDFYNGVSFQLKVTKANGQIQIAPSRTEYNMGIANTINEQTERLPVVTVNPDDMVILRFYSDLTYGLETIYEKGNAITIPALSLWAIMEKKKERDLSLGIKSVAMIITLPTALEGGWAAAFTLIDELALGSSVLIDDTGWRNLIKSDAGKTWLKTYDIFINVYFAGRALEITGAYNDLRINFSKWKTVSVESEETNAIIKKMSQLGKVDEAVGAINNEYEAVKSILSKLLDESTYQKLITDFGEGSMGLPEFLTSESKLNQDIFDSWQILKNAGRSGLCKKIDAIEALSKARNNAGLKKFGFNDDLLSSIHASKLSDGSYASIMEDLNQLGNTMAKNTNVEFENFNRLIGKLINDNTQDSQAAQWIMQDLTDNIGDFAGKKWTFELPLKNSDGNSAYIDMASNEIPPMTIEYKWLTTNSASLDDFVREFIKRDLFNSSDFSKIQWRIKGQKLTKEKVIEYLSSKEGSDALKQISAEKANNLLNRMDLEDAFPNEIVDAFIEYFNNSNNFSKILNDEIYRNSLLYRI